MFSVDYHLKIRRSCTATTERLFKSSEHFSDAGVDLYIQRDETISPSEQKKLRLGVHCEMLKNTKINFPGGGEYTLMEPVSYLLLPRSSISKTPLRMCNSIGLIDSGYRGEIMAVVENISNYEYSLSKGDRLFQLVNSDLKSFSTIDLVDDLTLTTRGDGGFGSTGK